MTTLIGTRCTNTCRLPSQSQAHCSVCHRTFGGVSGFDMHRRDGACVDPRKFGIVERDGLWRTPEGHDRREMDAWRLAEWRSQRPLVSAEPQTAPMGGSVQGALWEAPQGTVSGDL